MGTQSESKDITKKNLLNAFWSLYKKKSIDKITIREITQLAGYNRSTFYGHFIDIYDALDQIQDSVLDYTRIAIEKYRSEGPDQQIIEYMSNIFYVRREYFSVFLGENRDPNFPGKMKKVIQPIFYEVWGFPENSEEAACIFEFTSSALIGTLCYWYKNEKNMPYEIFLSMVTSMIANGVFAELRKISTHMDANSIFKEVFTQ